MDKIKSYVERFFNSKDKNRNYSLSTDDAITFINEIQGAEGDGLFRAICILYNYGYAKGYRACKAEQKKGARA